jgi:hypothetical protein
MASYCIMQGHSKNLKFEGKNAYFSELKIEYSPMRWLVLLMRFQHYNFQIEPTTILILTPNRSLCRNFFRRLCNGRDTVEAVKIRGLLLILERIPWFGTRRQQQQSLEQRLGAQSSCWKSFLTPSSSSFRPRHYIRVFSLCIVLSCCFRRRRAPLRCGNSIQNLKSIHRNRDCVRRVFCSTYFKWVALYLNQQLNEIAFPFWKFRSVIKSNCARTQIYEFLNSPFKILKW